MQTLWDKLASPLEVFLFLSVLLPLSLVIVRSTVAHTWASSELRLRVLEVTLYLLL